MKDFDAVFCISVIEHTDPDETFFRNLLKGVRPGGTFFLTTDFYPTGEIRNPGHSRTYNAETLERWGTTSPGFSSPGGFDYYYHGDFVFNYSFGSLHLRREP